MTTTQYAQIKADPKLTESLIALVRKHAIALEQLDEQQFVECLRQALLSGDFIKYVLQDSAQCYVYQPYREVELLRERIWDARMRIGMLYTRITEASDKIAPPLDLAGLASSIEEIEKTLAGIRPTLV